jgi:Putative undecaprenyl diphosphate synthase
VQALEWCLELGVPCVSVYAFSLENFNRSAAEVAVLMDLAEQKLLAILQVVMHPQHTPVVSLQTVPTAASDGHHKDTSAKVALCWLCCLLVRQPQHRMLGLRSAGMTVQIWQSAGARYH